MNRGPSLVPFGALAALGSAALFGVSTPLAKLLLSTVDPWLLAGLLYLGAGMGLALVIGARHALGHETNEAPLRRGDAPWLLAVIAAGGIAGPVLLMLGLAAAPASTGSLLLNLEGLFTLVIAWTVFRENVDRRIMLGAAAILTGAVILSWDGAASYGLAPGALWIVAACAAWGIDNNLTRKLSSADPVQITTIKGLAAGTVNVGIAFLMGSSFPAPEIVLGAMLIGFAGYGISLTLFVLALRHVGTARTGAYFSSAPFIGAVVAVALLGESASVGLLTAGVLMAIGLYLHLSERHEHDHQHEEMTHEHRHVHDDHHRHAHAADDPAAEPHTHVHTHARMIHRHPHYPDLHHRHTH